MTAEELELQIDRVFRALDEDFGDDLGADRTRAVGSRTTSRSVGTRRSTTSFHSWSTATRRKISFRSSAKHSTMRPEPAIGLRYEITRIGSPSRIEHSMIAPGPQLTANPPGPLAVVSCLSCVAGPVRRRRGWRGRRRHRAHTG